MDAHERFDQKLMISIMTSRPQVPHCRKKSASGDENGNVKTDKRPKGNTHKPKMGMVVRFAGIETRGIRWKYKAVRGSRK